MRPVWKVASATVGVAALSVAYALLVHARAVGDVKTGATGDPLLALHFENLATVAFVFGLLAISAPCAARHGLAVALGFATSVGLSLWLVLLFLTT